MDVQHQFFSLAQIAPPHHPISPAALPVTISPAAISIKSDPPLITVDDVDMDSDSDPSSGSDMDDDDDDDEDVDDSYKERSRGTRSGPPGTKSQRGSGAASAQRRASKGDGHSSGTVSTLSTNGKKSTGKAGASSDAGSTGAPSAPKKRGNGRITVAEFVPPDVTGLSKREARLVKNRAAAFLSRQRKREEFETMEARLSEALQENARLKAQKGQTDSPPPAPQDDAEVQRLRALLREAEERERTLRMEVEQTRQQQPSQPSPQIVKTEEPEFFLRMPGGLDIGSPEPMVQDRRVFSTKDKERHGGPGLSLMILVFSLSLLSLPHGQQLQGHLNDGQSAPTRISFAPSGSSAVPLPVLSNLIEKWEGGMDMIDGVEDEGSDNEMEVELEAGDQDDNGDGAFNQDKKTYTVDFEMPVLADDSQTDEDGKIRVRIQPCGAPRPRRTPRVPQAQVTPVEGLTPFTVPPFSADNMFDPSAYAADAENWAGWTEFLNEEVFSADSQANAHLVPADMPAAALSPMSEPEATVFIGSDTASERYLTPPPFVGDSEASGNLSPSPETEPPTDATTGDNKESLDVDLPLSQLPVWSRALVRAVAGEKVRAKIRMTRGPKWGAEKTAKLKARAGSKSKSKIGFTLCV